MSPIWLNWFLVAQYVVLAGWYLIDSQPIKAMYRIGVAVMK